MTAPLLSQVSILKYDESRHAISSDDFSKTKLLVYENRVINHLLYFVDENSSIR